MLREGTTCPDGATVHPPGTVPLVSHQWRHDSGTVVLAPTPSDDPEDPLNWSWPRKILNYGVLMALTTTIFISLLIQNVFWPLMMDELGMTFDEYINGQAVQLVGLATGCIFFIPFTKKYGRRSTYVLSTVALAALAWWTAYMTTAVENYITNLLFGLASAINETAVQMSIADLFFLHHRATANGIYFAAVCIGSYLMPIPAGVIASNDGWRASYRALAMALTILAVIFVLAFEETKFVRVISGRPSPAIKTGTADDFKPTRTRESVVAGPPEVEDGSYAESTLLRRYLDRLRFFTPTDESLWKSAYMPLYTVTLPHVAFTSLQFGSGVCWLVVLGAMMGAIFTEPPYSFGPAEIGYMFLGAVVGTIFGSVYGGPLVDWHVLRAAKRNNGLFEPEMRIALYHLPAICSAGGLIMFGITADRGMHWIYPSIGSALFAFGFGAIGDMAFTLVVDSCPGLVPESFVAVTFIRNALSLAGPFALASWRAKMSISNMFITAGCIGFAINLLWIPMSIWGRNMRAYTASRYYNLCQEVGAT